MRRPPGRGRDTYLFATLMALSAFAALAPPAWTRWSQNLLQPLAWGQWAVSGAARSAAQSSGAPPSDLSREQLDALRAELRRLRNQTLNQEALIQTLRDRVDELARLRDALGLLDARIIFADVMAADAAPRRETLLLSRGGVGANALRVGDWVASGAAPGEAAHATGFELMLQQWLVGQVESVAAITSRVRLVTDPEFGPLTVMAARRLEVGTLEVAETRCLLYGAGGGRMTIRDATENLLDSGHTLVLAAPGPGLPAALAVGVIVSAEALPESALHFNLEVRPLASPSRLAHVYVIAPSR